MIRWLTVLWLTVFWAVGLNAETLTKASLLLSAETAPAGSTVMAGVRLEMPEGYHTYWRYGGDAGAPTTIEWILPKGVTAGAIQWPLPEKYSEEGIYSYIYHGEAILLVPLTIAPGTTGTLPVKAKVSWLECKKLCLPGEGEVAASLVVGPELKPSPEAPILKKASELIPVRGGAKAVAKWEEAVKGGRMAAIDWEVGPGLGKPDFLPLPDDSYEAAGETEVTPLGDGHFKLRKMIRKLSAWPVKLDGVLAAHKADGSMAAFEVSLPLPVEPGAAMAPSQAGRETAEQAPAQAAEPLALGAFLLKLAAAFLGGMILNIMPCVLPVVALKIMGFVGQSRSAPGRVRQLGLIYGAGVVISFLVLAGVVIGVNAIGQKASWGMQLQNTPFVVLMTILVTLIALNLFGVFEVVLGGGAMDAAGSLASREGAPGAFFNGVLATALATPCTAPFLGAALGFAFGQPPAIILLVFFMVGAGMAFPYVLLSWHPGWLRFLPKPGAWMERFKNLMGFPMLATAIWLASLAVEALGPGSVLWVGLLLVMVGLIAWIWGEFWQRGRRRSALLIALVLAAGTYGYVMEGKLRWRSAVEPVATTDIIKQDPEGIEWRRWSPEAVAAARADGRPVLVDFTASWCLTCQVNAKTSLEIPEVKARLKAINAVALLENSFKKSAQVVSELNRHGRAGVPLVLVYSKDPAQPPQVLPELLTPRIVLDALDKAVK